MSSTSLKSVGNYRSISVLLPYSKKAKDTWAAIQRTHSALRFRSLISNHSASCTKLLKDLNCMFVHSLLPLAVLWEAAPKFNLCVDVHFLLLPYARWTDSWVPQTGFWILFQNSLKHRIFRCFCLLLGHLMLPHFLQKKKTLVNRLSTVTLLKSL